MFRNILIPFLVLAITGCRQDVPLRLSDTTAQTEARLEELLPKRLAQYSVSGVGVAVIRDTETVLVKSFGIADRRTNTPIGAHTIFEAASLGKPIFAYIAVSLAQAGSIDLDVPLVSCVPDLFSGSDAALKKITARMVLFHSSGLPNFAVKRDEGVLFDPGSNFTYPGIAFEKLQRVLEVITGKTLDQLANEIVFAPFGMTSSSYVWAEQFDYRIAFGHDSTGTQADQIRKVKEGHAAWSFLTTTADYARFVERSMRETDPVAAAMNVSQITITDEISWGMGWGIQSTKPHPSFWHWGSNPGYRSYVVGYPSEKFLVLFLSNSDNMFKLIEEIVDMTIGGDLPSYRWF